MSKQYNPFTVLILVPVIYYLIGGYSWIYLVVYLVYILLYEKDKKKYFYGLLLLCTALFSLIIFKEVLFSQPYDQLIRYPLPSIKVIRYRIFFFIAVGYIIFFSCWGKIIFLNSVKWLNKKVVSGVFSLLILFVAIVGVVELYNPQTQRVLKMEKWVYDEKWEEAIAFHENFPSLNLIGQYFYNIALSETDQLCERLFRGRQDFGTKALMLPWSNEYINWGGYFFYTIGLINEAHRWAYEEMVVYGFRPQNVKLLAKTSLINGNYERAEKYLHMLGKTLYYRQWANEYEKLVTDTTLFPSHPELGGKRDLMPRSNFFIRINSPQENIPLLLNANPQNKKAYEYLMAWFLLSRNVTAIIDNISNLKNLNYIKIPRHIEEAILAYYDSTGEMPELYGLTINQKTVENFKQYVSAYKSYRNAPSLLKNKLKERFGDTFWYYFHFR